MGKPFKSERIGDMFQLSWLESVITEASLMTRSIKLHSMLMNWMCFPLQGLGGFAPQRLALCGYYASHEVSRIVGILTGLKELREVLAILLIFDALRIAIVIKNDPEGQRLEGPVFVDLFFPSSDLTA